MLRIIDKERKMFTGTYTTGYELNEFRMQLQFKDDILKIVATNRGSSVYLLNEKKSWTELKSFEDFSAYDNLAANFLIHVSTYLNSFYNTDEFDTLTD